MNDLTDGTPPEEDPGPSAAYSAASTASGRSLSNLWDWGRGEDEALIDRAAATQAWAQLARCFPHWRSAKRNLHSRALRRLAANKPVDPNDKANWSSSDAHATAVLRRHGMSTIDSLKLSDSAVTALIHGQRAADEQAGVDWGRLHAPPSVIDDALREAHRTLPIDITDPQMWKWPEDQRRVLAETLGVDAVLADDLSRWALAHPDRFDTSTLRCWRIASGTWLKLAGEQLAPVETVERPVGVFIAPAIKQDGWSLEPCLSLDMVRLVAELGGHLERSLRDAVLPLHAGAELLARINNNTLHTGSKDMIESATQLSTDLSGLFDQTVRVSLTRDKRDRWGRVHVRKSTWKGNDGRARGELHLTVMTTTVKTFTTKRLGVARVDSLHGAVTRSAAMELGEAVNCAVERGLPLLLSSEAAGMLDGTVRVGRMKGRPGMITITSSDGVEATTARLVAEQAVSRLRALRDADQRVILDAGAKQLVRMTVAKPLSDDPVLVGRQQEIAALMAVGSGVNASQTGTGKTVVTARGALYQRASKTKGFRGLVVAEGRLLGQWLTEVTEGAPGRGMPPLVPNARFHVLDERTSIAAQIRAFHRDCGTDAGVVLVPNSILDRYPGDLMVISWHLLVADEALRYVNPLTEAHRALRTVRMGAVADCWLLTATPKGKTSEHLDVLVGLAVGDDGMIRERLATREAGDLMDEINAHRLRVNYGPHLVRITRADMKAWMPEVRPAEPIIVEPDSAMAELLEAIRKGGQDAYRRLLEVLRELKKLERGSELHQQALVELSRCQGVVLGNVGVYVDASVDPETLKYSKAALAQALTRQGLVDAAIRGGGDGQPTLRGIVAQAIAGIVADEQVIVFADRVRCLHQLAATLNDRHGIETHVADGRIDEHDFEELKRGFVAGEYPVLCLSKIGQEGHNLQNASTIVELDLPWVPTGLEQRVGRSARPGNTRGYVATFIPYLKGGGVEHIVKILSERGGEHHQILDSYEGVAASDSTIATQLGAITAQVADSKQEAGYAGTAARLRVAASVFGAAAASSHDRLAALKPHSAARNGLRADTPELHPRSRARARASPRRHGGPMPSALTAGLDQIDQVAADGDLDTQRLEDIDLDVDSVGDPIVLPDGKRIYPPMLHGAPVHELACQLLDMQAPERSRFLRLVGPPGTGKALAVETPVATPAGWTTMGALKVGDLVFGPDGRPIPVIATSPVMFNRSCLEVVFSDGSTIVADADHLWATETRADRTRAPRRERRGVSRRLGSDEEVAAVRDAIVKPLAARNVTRRELARELGWDTMQGYRRVKTASARCERVGHSGREVAYDRALLLRSLERMLCARLGEHNSRRIADAPITTRQLADTLTAAGRVNHAVRVAEPLALPEAQFAVGPRLLGLWLGDGDSSEAAFTTADPELVAEFEGGYTVQQSSKMRYTIASKGLGRRRPAPCVACGSSIQPGRQRRWFCDACLPTARARDLRVPERHCACGTPLRREVWSDTCSTCLKRGSLRIQLRDLGVLDNKHIPTAYQRASPSQRRALLSGLLDTDGTVARTGAVEYTTTSARLADDVHELACSLGYRAVRREGRARLAGKDCGPKWTVTFTTRDVVFGLRRKQHTHAERTRGASNARTRLRYVIDVRPVDSVPVRCIQVGNPDGLFLAGRTLITTHNSQIARAIAYELWTQRGNPVEERHGQPFYGFVEMQPGPSSDEFFFRYDYVPAATGGDIRLVDSSFVEAMRNGWVVMIDEVNTARDVALLSINGTLDGRLTLHLPATGETVRAQPGFAVILAYNPGLVGATDIPDAWRSRFPATLEVTSNWAALIKLGAPELLVKAAKVLDARRFADDGLVWTPQFRDIEALADMMTRVGERAAIALFMSNIAEQVGAGTIQPAEASALTRMLDEAGYAHLKVPATSRIANLDGYPRAVTG